MGFWEFVPSTLDGWDGWTLIGPPPPVVAILHTKFRKINLHNITHSVISSNPRGWTFVVQISLLTVTFLSLISWLLSLMQATKEVNPHPRIAPSVNMWSVTFLFFFFSCNVLNVGACVRHSPGKAKRSGPQQRRWEENIPNFIVSHATLILQYHTSMLTLQNSILSRALWLPQMWYYGDLECIHLIGGLMRKVSE